MEWWVYLSVIFVGFLVGFINTLAGSGSLLSLPLLIFLGLPANVANGTNRIGILLQSLVAVGSFKKSGTLQWKEGLRISIPAVIGSVIGAAIAVDINEKIMNRVIGILLVIMLVLLIINPEKILKSDIEQKKVKEYWKIGIIFLLIGFYGGFIQAGVGFFLLAGLVWGVGFDLIRANAVKVLIVLIYTPFALIVFLLNKQVDFSLGIILALGSMLGAYCAARLAISKGVKFVRYFVIVILLLCSLKMTGVIELFLSKS
jgi:uncharacterized membrane protein YfcA